MKLRRGAAHWLKPPSARRAGRLLLPGLLLLVAAAPLAAFKGCSTAPPLQNAPPLVEHLDALGDPGADIVQLNTRPGVRQGFLLLRAARPKASLILFVGGQGELGLERADRVQRLERPKANFLVRICMDLVRRGFTVALVDTPSDQPSLARFRTSALHAQDIQGVSAYLRSVAPVPVWAVGTSRGTISAANAAARLGSPDVSGLVLTSIITRQSGRGDSSVYNTDLSAIRVPTLLVGHVDDGCPVSPPGGMEMLARSLPHAPVVEMRTFQGGKPPVTGECEPGSPHGYWGIEPQVVDAISAWILAHLPAGTG